ncbi:glycosyltransferase [Marivirga sp.]|uniref:glycosyltransferase n=1 Tax=Marivirga sp. TaxID=2018662 RepID=UPI002D804999|nr:glycosyltransferase [Marivirga sp.]HET8860437.1 glycosyltransferase [Marivirga sp.]
MIFAFFALIILFYALALLFATSIWRKLPELGESGELKSVSILIPFRNETENLNSLLNSLSKVDYPTDLLNVILINDHSTDGFKEIIKSHEDRFPFKMIVLSLPEQLKGKKSALNAGIKHSKSEIILTTDADCIFPKDWVQKMQAPFEINHIELVSGSVVFRADGMRSKLFQMEFAPLIGVGAISIELGNPTMANGANLAFRKTTFEMLNPYGDNLRIPSGDDIFLLQKIKKKFPNGVYFQKDAVVETHSPDDFNSFYRQRKRWAAKWRASSSFMDSFPALLVWLFHLVYLTAIIYHLILGQFLLMLPVVLLKICSEGIFISLILKSQHKKFNFLAFATLQFLYSLYVLIFGLLANFGNYTWKERKYISNERAGN